MLKLKTMRKRNLFTIAYLAMGAAVAFTSCSNDEEVLNGNGNSDVQELVLQTVSSGNGLSTRGGRPLESSEAKQKIDKVKLIITQGDGEHNIVYTTICDDWMSTSSTYDGDGHGRKHTIELSGNDKLAPGSYTVYAVGYTKPSDSDYDLTTFEALQKGGQFQENMKLSFKEGASNKVGEEIFAGSLSLTVKSGEGFRESVVLNRQVAGAFAYVTDIPYIKDATKLQLVASTRNKQLVLGNFANFDLPENGTATEGNGLNYVVNGTEAEATDKVIYAIWLREWFKTVQDLNDDGIIDNGSTKETAATGKDNWTGNGEKYATGSVFGSSFVIPFEKVASNSTFTLQLVKDNGQVLRSWAVKLPTENHQTAKQFTLTCWDSSTNKFSTKASQQDSKDIYSVLRNHLYGIGKRNLDTPTNPGTDPDEPEPLLTKQELVLRVNDNWEAVYEMDIE